jgi:CheY-like chemotaxis protein
MDEHCKVRCCMINEKETSIFRFNGVGNLSEISFNNSKQENHFDKETILCSTCEYSKKYWLFCYLIKTKLQQDNTFFILTLSIISNLTNMTRNIIICVDDEKIILDSLLGQLQRNLGDRYLYEFAESAEEAMALLVDLKGKGFTIHTVISDWLMPEMKGDEFLTWVHQNFVNANKILLTGHMDNDVVQVLECCNTEDISCLYKPWDEKELLALIEK